MKSIAEFWKSEILKQEFFKLEFKSMNSLFLLISTNKHQSINDPFSPFKANHLKITAFTPLIIDFLLASSFTSASIVVQSIRIFKNCHISKYLYKHLHCFLLTTTDIPYSKNQLKAKTKLKHSDWHTSPSHVCSEKMIL